ncbi:hypothetical protein GGR51DRAFT_556673 [Nemania sp. FL0031]|nr:hypothetical protein GGR51DRAFT_556673 [Nemania sp. FL0031]
MEFFCVRMKPHHTRGEAKKEEDIKKKEISILRVAQIEARRSGDLARNRKLGKQSHRKSRARAMSAQSHTSASPADVVPSDEEPQCSCVCCRTRARARTQVQHARTPTPTPTQTGSPSRPLGGDDILHGLDSQVDSQAQQNLQHSTAPVSQIYVHPYSTQHHRFPVVDHSITCHGRRPDSHPVYYVAIVPDAANLEDIEAALVGRPGLVVMTRLSGSEELVPIHTYLTTRGLFEASMQLEIWDRDNV